MSKSNRKSIFALCTITILLFVGNAFGSDRSSSGAMLPEGLRIKDGYRAGLGAPVGRVVLVKGKVVIQHARVLYGYWAKKGLPLFKGDIIVTLAKGKISFKLNDRSIMTLASNTRLVINKSVFNKKKRSRFSFLKLSIGKARFFVTKLFKSKYSNFKVKTPTAIIGVRGSDFIIKATLQTTEVTALEKTQVEVVSTSFPETKPLMITDFERTTVEKGAPPSEIVTLEPEEVVQIKREFTLDAKPVEHEVKAGGGAEKGEKKDKGDSKGTEEGKSEGKEGKGEGAGQGKSEEGKEGGESKEGEGGDEKGKEGESEEGGSEKNESGGDQSGEGSEGAGGGEESEQGTSGEGGEVKEDGALGEESGGEVSESDGESGEGGGIGSVLGEVSGGEEGTSEESMISAGVEGDSMTEGGMTEGDMTEGGMVEESMVEGGVLEENMIVETPIFVSDLELVKPEGMLEIQVFEEPISVDIFQAEEISSNESMAVEQQEQISQVQHEEVIAETIKAFPQFPGMPQ